MRRIASVFLAGPDIWFPDAERLAERRRALCDVAGYRGQTSLDGPRIEKVPSEAMARELYANAVGAIRKCDALIANLTPWRGPHCDPATAFACGFASAIGKPVFAYMNVETEAEADQRERIERVAGARLDGKGEVVDEFGCAIEDFGLPESLMLWAEARRLFVIVTPDPLGDLTGLELSLDALRLYADA